MFLFHGSNSKIHTPELDKGRSPLDFGVGFYMTSSKTQAIQWAMRKAKRVAHGLPTLNIYYISEEILTTETLKIKRFSGPTLEWLDFVVSHRSETYEGELFDIIIGPVADDSVMRTIRLYVNGIYTKEEATRRFKTEVLDNQYLFATKLALSHLIFKEAIIL